MTTRPEMPVDVREGFEAMLAELHRHEPAILGTGDGGSSHSSFWHPRPSRCGSGSGDSGGSRA